MFLKSTFLTISFLLFFLSSLLAEELPTFDLGKIVISKDETTLFGIPAATAISSEDIEIRNAQFVDEALDFIPGLRVSVGQKNEPELMIRGFSQDKILILLDGMPIANPPFGFVDLNQIPVEGIAEIRVIKGGTSVLYGANTLGGAINIITKGASLKPHLELNLGVDNESNHFFTLNYGLKSEKDLSLWVAAGHRQSDGFKLSKDTSAQRNEDGALRENSFFEKDSLSLKVGLEKERHNLFALFNYIDNEKGIPPSVSSNRPRYWRFSEWKKWMAALVGETKITDQFSLKGRLFYDKYDNTLNSYDDANYNTQLARSSWTSVYDDYALGSTIYLNFYPNQQHEIKGAINFKKDVHREQDDTDEPWENSEIRTYSFGLEDEIRLNEQLSLLIGASFDLFDQARTATAEKGDKISAVNPLLNINYFLLPETLIYSSVSQRTRFPTISQLYSNTSGNPQLNEQRNINGEIGVKHDFRKLVTFELSYFYNNVRDLIDRASRNDPFLNISKAIFEGIEVTIHANLKKQILAQLSYTYLDARDKNPELFGRTEEELSYVPKHKTDFELAYSQDSGLSAHLLGSYHGRRFYYDSNSVQHALGGYFVWDFRLAQRFLENWQGSIYIENIFDRNYQEEEGYPQPGRTVLFNIQATF